MSSTESTSSTAPLLPPQEQHRTQQCKKASVVALYTLAIYGLGYLSVDHPTTACLIGFTGGILALFYCGYWNSQKRAQPSTVSASTA